MTEDAHSRTTKKTDSGLNWYGPPLEDVRLILVEELLVAKAESLISGCERCDESAEISFDYLLDALSGCDPARTEYLMNRFARCPGCHGPVTEKTLVTAE